MSAVRVAVIGTRSNEANPELVQAWHALPGRDVYSAAATALGLLPPPRLRDLRRTVVVR